MASGETERRQEDGVGEDHVRPLNHYRNFELQSDRKLPEVISVKVARIKMESLKPSLNKMGSGDHDGRALRTPTYDRNLQGLSENLSITLHKEYSCEDFCPATACSNLRLSSNCLFQVRVLSPLLSVLLAKDSCFKITCYLLHFIFKSPLSFLPPWVHL